MSQPQGGVFIAGAKRFDVNARSFDDRDALLSRHYINVATM
jgi:hypothetical protein